MKLFKVLFCNLVYHHRHSKNFGYREIAVMATFGMIFFNILFFLLGTSILIDIVFDFKAFVNFRLAVVFSLIPTIFIYWKICCGKRYIGILRNSKYCYTKKRYILTICFNVGCLLYFCFVFILGGLHNTKSWIFAN